MAQCTATSKQSGERCKRRASVGRSVCAIHGGKSRTGAAVAGFKGGRHSKYLPTRLAARYQEAQNDPDLISLHDDIALIDTRLGELVERVGEDDPTALWQQARRQIDAYKDAQKRASRDQVAHLAALEVTIAQGVADAPSASWRQVFDLLEQRRRSVESESKRLQQLQQMIPAEGVLTLIGLVELAIKRHVTNPQQLAAIAQDLMALSTQHPRHIIDAERADNERA